MGSSNLDPARRLAAIAGLALFAAGCTDTGFGQPCSLPKVDEIRRACEEGPAGNDSDDLQITNKPSCAVRNFAGCETLVCLVYRGSDPFCSEPCTDNDDCEGSAECRPLIGDLEQQDDLCKEEGSDCYCIRKADLAN